ncbi:MAG: LytTR family transcriptional regulator DNA-binding domain-containing protein [Clostridia bacterium]|nr:LytTR family transcriptional regulator DNA-binding domain-containing protein [Clostridia bacterium]
MVSVLLNSGSAKELKYIEDLTRHLAAKISEEGWNHHAFNSMEDVLDFLCDNPLLDIACVDLTLEKGLDGAKRVRSLNPGTFMMVIANTHISPMSYISPDVMATSLILRPFNGAQLTEVFSKMIKAYFKKNTEKDIKEEVFVIEAKEGKQLIPYERIYCFEAREKKVFAVTDSMEYSFYDTIENLEEILPKYFIRSHRGFIVNSEKISKIMLSQNLIILDDETEVPLSRSYKGSFKGLLSV